MGQRIHCGPFVFQCKLGPSGTPARLGLIASRRVGNAGTRNYGKRVFRELFRRHADLLPAGSELVVVIRRGFDGYTFDQLEARFMAACRKLEPSTAEPA